MLAVIATAETTTKLNIPKATLKLSSVIFFNFLSLSR